MKTYQTRLKTRPTDLDRSWQISSTALLQYTECVRWKTIEEHVMGMDRIFDDGRSIMVRSQKLEILQPLNRYPAVDVSLWIDRVGRSSILLVHDVMVPDVGTIATLHVTGVCLDRDGRPVEVPDEVRDLARHSDPPERSDVFWGTQRPTGVFETSIDVRHADIDVMQHINHAVYLDYYVDAEARLVRKGAIERSAALSLTEVELHYQRQAFPGERLTIASWVLETTDEQFTMAHELLRPGETDPINRARLTRTRQ